MKNANAISLLKRCLGNLENRIPQMQGQEYFSPTDRYTSAARFDAEMNRVFRRSPCLVGHVSQLAEEHSYIANDICGTPILITRTGNGQFKAFVNACRHRGTQLVDNGSGCKNRFVCPYHGWTYTADGTLRGVPFEEGFPGLDRSTSGLIELPLWERQGLIWVLPQPGTSFDFEAFWQPVAEELVDYNISDMIEYRPVAKTWQGNWKLFVEGSMETYHFKVTHKETIAPFFHNNASVTDALNPHFRCLIPKTTISSLRDAPVDNWTLAGHTHMVYILFPNSILLIQKDHIVAIVLKPLSPGQTEIAMQMLIPEKVFREKDQSYWDHNYDITERTLAEDFKMGEAIQRGITGGALESLRFGRFEHCVEIFHEYLEELIANGWPQLEFTGESKK